MMLNQNPPPLILSVFFFFEMEKTCLKNYQMVRTLRSGRFIGLIKSQFES